MSTRSAIRLAERRAKALELRVGGASFREIGTLTGTDRGTAWRDVERAIIDHVAVPVRQALVIELARLDALLASFMPRAQAGDVPAAHVVLKCIERRSKFLGLDQPQRLIVEADLVPVVPINDPAEAYARSVAILDEILGPAPEYGALGTIAEASGRETNARRAVTPKGHGR